MKKLALVLIICFSVLSSAMAAPYYDTGSQMFTINVGAAIPFFTYNAEDDGVYWGPGQNEPGNLQNMNEFVGGQGSIAYQVFVNPYWALGGELGYQFNYAGGNNIGSSVPILFKVSAYPFQNGFFEIPISLGIGLNYLSFQDSSKLSFSAKIEIGMMFYFNDEWGLGVLGGFNFIPEIYFTEGRSQYSGIKAYSPISISVAYRH